MYEFICVLFLFKQNSTIEFMKKRRVVLRESVSVPTAGIGQIGGAYLRERSLSKLDTSCLRPESQRENWLLFACLA